MHARSHSLSIAFENGRQRLDLCVRGLSYFSSFSNTATVRAAFLATVCVYIKPMNRSIEINTNVNERTNERHKPIYIKISIDTNTHVQRDSTRIGSVVSLSSPHYHVAIRRLCRCRDIRHVY